MRYCLLIVFLAIVPTNAGFGKGILGGGKTPASIKSEINSGNSDLHRTTLQRTKHSNNEGVTVIADREVCNGANNDDACEEFAPLQVLCEVNGFMVPAIIDTGAQITIMSASCAKRCRISNSIDTRYSGRAVGVGSSDIIGRIDGLGMRVGPVSFESKVSILREARVDFLIGLDLLQRFKTEVNLKDHVLKLQVRDRVYKVQLLNKNSDIEVPGSAAQLATSMGALEDPDYYEGEFSYPDEDVLELPTASSQTPQSPSGGAYRQRSSHDDRSSGNFRSKEPAVSLEGV